jgi:large subunit ribosomal protein L9
MAAPVEVILTKDIKGVGKLGDRKQVRPGFARNYLLPQGIALIVNADNLERFKVIKKRELKRMAQEKAEAEALKAQLDGKKFTFTETAKENGKLYGSVSPAKVSDAIKAELHLEVDRKILRMPDHIKEAGSYDVTVELKAGLEAKIHIEVISQPEKSEKVSKKESSKGAKSTSAKGSSSKSKKE